MTTEQRSMSANEAPSRFAQFLIDSSAAGLTSIPRNVISTGTVMNDREVQLPGHRRDVRMWCAIDVATVNAQQLPRSTAIAQRIRDRESTCAAGPLQQEAPCLPS